MNYKTWRASFQDSERAAVKAFNSWQIERNERVLQQSREADLFKENERLKMIISFVQDQCAMGTAPHELGEKLKRGLA